VLTELRSVIAVRARETEEREKVALLRQEVERGGGGEVERGGITNSGDVVVDNDTCTTSVSDRQDKIGTQMLDLNVKTGGGGVIPACPSSVLDTSHVCDAAALDALCRPWHIGGSGGAHRQPCDKYSAERFETEYGDYSRGNVSERGGHEGLRTNGVDDEGQRGTDSQLPLSQEGRRVTDARPPLSSASVNTFTSRLARQAVERSHQMAVMSVETFGDESDSDEVEEKEEEKEEEEEDQEEGGS